MKKFYKEIMNDIIADKNKDEYILNQDSYNNFGKYLSFPKLIEFPMIPYKFPFLFPIS